MEYCITGQPESVVDDQKEESTQKTKSFDEELKVLKIMLQIYENEYGIADSNMIAQSYEFKRFENLLRAYEYNDYKIDTFNNDTEDKNMTTESVPCKVASQKTPSIKTKDEITQSVGQTNV